MRAGMLAPVVLLLSLPGCKTQQSLCENTVLTAETLADVNYQQILNNVARFEEDPAVLPSIAGIGTGGTTVTDHCTINVSPTYVPTLAYAQQIGAGLPILSLFINPTYDRLVTENWALQPVVSADHRLRDIGGAFQFLVARAEDGPDADTLSHLAEALSTENEPLEVLIPRGWYHVGTKHAVPADACFVGHHRQTYVWVTRDGVPGLSRFTLTVLQLAEAGEEKEAVAKKAEAGKAAAAHSERYDEVAPGSLPRRLEGTR